MVLLFIKTSFINTYNTFKNWFIYGESFLLSYLLFDFSTVKRREKTNSLRREQEIICFKVRNNAFHKNTVGSGTTGGVGGGGGEVRWVQLHRSREKPCPFWRNVLPHFYSCTAIKRNYYACLLLKMFIGAAKIIYNQLFNDSDSSITM